MGGGNGKENIELSMKSSEANREGKKGGVLTAGRRPGGDRAARPWSQLCEFVQGVPPWRGVPGSWQAVGSTETPAQEGWWGHVCATTLSQHPVLVTAGMTQ